jgi:hypothetical protein
MKKLGLFFILFGYLIFVFIFPVLIKDTIISTCLLFITIIMPSILPMYLLGNFLMSTNILSKAFYPILKKLLPLENEHACTIYLLSIIMGNPTTSILINESINKNIITHTQAKKLMSITFFMNPLFVINVLPKEISLPIIMSCLLSSFIIAFTIKNKNYYQSNNNIKDTFWYTLDKTPSILLNILMIMLLISLIKTPFSMFNKPFLLTYLIDCLDISTGLININNYSLSNIQLLILSSILINTNGLCLFLQTIRYTPFIKTKELIKKRLTSTLISLFITLFIYLLFYC